MNKKITLKGKTKIIDNKYVIKKKSKDIKSLYTYLDSRSFSNYPKIISEDDSTYTYEYLDSIDIPLTQKSVDMASLLGDLHSKTSFYKNIVKDDIKRIYELILGNILYLEDYYTKIFILAENEEYMRPSYYLLIRNQNKINDLIKYLKNELESWYQSMITKEKERVVYNHNNLNIEHYISNKNAFISWDHYQIDTPILDLINLYHNDFNKYDYSIFLKEYLKYNDLSNEEKRLLFIMISIPKVVYFTDNEMNNTISIGKLIDYIDKTSNLVRPYYPIDKKEEN